MRLLEQHIVTAGASVGSFAQHSRDVHLGSVEHAEPAPSHGGHQGFKLWLALLRTSPSASMRYVNCPTSWKRASP